MDRQWFQSSRWLLRLLNMPGAKGLRRYLGIDPEGSLQDLGPWFSTVSLGGKSRTTFYGRPLIAHRVYRTFWPLLWVLHGYDQILPKAMYPSLGFGLDVLTVYPDRRSGLTTVDGSVGRSAPTGSEAFSTIRTSPGNAASTDAGADWNGWLYGSTLKRDTFAYLFRGVLTFDTSPIGAGATIHSAYLGLHGYFKQNTLGSTDLHITSASPASWNNLMAGDYGSLGTVSAGSIGFSSFTIGSYNNIYLNSYGVGLITTTGITALGTRLGWDLTGVFGGVWSGGAETTYMSYSADVYTPGLAPKLVVVYTRNPAPKVIVVDS